MFKLPRFEIRLHSNIKDFGSDGLTQILKGRCGFLVDDCTVVDRSKIIRMALHRLVSEHARAQ